MARPKRSHSLTITDLSPEDMAWLKSESRRRGIDSVNIVRSMIRAESGKGTGGVPIISGNGTSSAPNYPIIPPKAALIAGLSDAEYDLAMELSQEELIIAHQTGGLKQYLTKLQAHTSAAEARMARGGLNGVVPIAPLAQISASRQAKLEDGAA
jgi:hypothetical protein